MIYEVYQRLDHGHHIEDYVVLDHDIRVKGRFKVTSKKGVEVRVFLERGKTLRVGEVLKTECGKEIEILGAEEDVTRATCDDWAVFSKACYHLGNRHVKIQIGSGSVGDNERWLRMKSDYVLEEMLELLGLTVTKENAVFLPEDGAYSGGGHGHGHGHSHGHSHGEDDGGHHHH